MTDSSTKTMPNGPADSSVAQTIIITLLIEELIRSKSIDPKGYIENLRAVSDPSNPMSICSPNSKTMIAKMADLVEGMDNRLNEENNGEP